MPRARKPPGMAVDRRNGQRAELAAAELKRFALPRRSDGRPYDLRTRRVWSALWDDQALAAVLVPADRELLIRWAEAVDDGIKARAEAWSDPIARGSMGQEVESPYFKVAAAAVGLAERCEQQLGIGALSRARLGIAILAEQVSLADLAARFDGGGLGDEPDPRLGG